MTFVGDYLAETIAIAEGIDRQAIEDLVALLEGIRAAHGRLFVLGLGGSAANASHAAADFRMRAGINAEAPESLPELTALANDHGWAEMFMCWLVTRHLSKRDLVLVLSVGGGEIPAPMTSWPLVIAVRYALGMKALTAAIVGEPGGAVGPMVDALVQIPVVAPERKTEHCEAWQAIIWHLLCARLGAACRN